MFIRVHSWLNGFLVAARLRLRGGFWLWLGYVWLALPLLNYYSVPHLVHSDTTNYGEYFLCYKQLTSIFGIFSPLIHFLLDDS